MPKRADINHYSTVYWYLRPFWSDCLNLKEPLPDTLQLYLNRYAKEDVTEFSERIKRLAQVNFVDMVIEAYCSMIFGFRAWLRAWKSA